MQTPEDPSYKELSLAKDMISPHDSLASSPGKGLGYFLQFDTPRSCRSRTRKRTSDTPSGKAKLRKSKSTCSKLRLAEDIGTVDTEEHNSPRTRNRSESPTRRRSSSIAESLNRFKELQQKRQELISPPPDKENEAPVDNDQTAETVAATCKSEQPQNVVQESRPEPKLDSLTATLTSGYHSTSPSSNPSGARIGPLTQPLSPLAGEYEENISPDAAGVDDAAQYEYDLDFALPPDEQELAFPVLDCDGHDNYSAERLDQNGLIPTMSESPPQVTEQTVLLATEHGIPQSSLPCESNIYIISNDEAFSHESEKDTNLADANHERTTPLIKNSKHENTTPDTHNSVPMTHESQFDEAEKSVTAVQAKSVNKCPIKTTSECNTTHASLTIPGTMESGHFAIKDSNDSSVHQRAKAISFSDWLALGNRSTVSNKTNDNVTASVSLTSTITSKQQSSQADAETTDFTVCDTRAVFHETTANQDSSVKEVEKRAMDTNAVMPTMTSSEHLIDTDTSRPATETHSTDDAMTISTSSTADTSEVSIDTPEVITVSTSGGSLAGTVAPMVEFVWLSADETSNIRPTELTPPQQEDIQENQAEQVCCLTLSRQIGHYRYRLQSRDVHFSKSYVSSWLRLLRFVLN